MSGILDKAAQLADEAISKIEQGASSTAGSDEMKTTKSAQASRDVRPVAGETEDNFATADQETRIRTLAYQLWQAEGCPDGREKLHWAQAEQTIASEDAARNI